MIVVDTNVITYLLLQGEHSISAEKVAEKDGDWHAPLLWRSEMLNVLTGYIRHGKLSVDSALSVMKDANAMVKGEVETSEAAVLHLILISNCSSYDCEFISAAETLQVPLITADKQLLRSFPDVAISMRDFLVS